MRNLYLTGSDAAMGLDYAYGREDGLRDAYDVMLGATVAELYDAYQPQTVLAHLPRRAMGS